MEIDYNLILAILGIILGVIGIVQTIKNQRKKIPYFDISNSFPIQKLIKSEQIAPDTTHKNHSDLTITRIGIWNDGVETIYENDIPIEDPFMIELDNRFKILDAKIISKKFDYISVAIKKDQNKIYLNFNYLEKKSWFVLKIKHTGTYSNCFTTKGKVIGGKELKRIPNSSSNNPKYEPVLYDYLALISGLIILLLVYEYSESINFFSILFVFMGLMFAVIGGIRIFEIKLPKDLKRKLGK